MKTDDRLLQAVALTVSLGFLSAWVGAVGSSSAAPAQRPVAVVSDVAAAQPAAVPAAAAAQADPIVEVYSDGGYWYWLEHEPN